MLLMFLLLSLICGWNGERFLIDWIAKITPVFKGGFIIGGNYWSISVLPVIFRVLEKCTNTRVYDHLKLHKLLNPIQFGFRKGRTTKMALSYITLVINRALDNKFRVAGLFLDLIKAFDTVDHQLIIRKCIFYGLRGAALALLCDYLKNREQYVHINRISSSEILVKFGIPQGSVLGHSLLFLFYEWSAKSWMVCHDATWHDLPMMWNWCVVKCDVNWTTTYLNN